jgi:hypothetical protein
VIPIIARFLRGSLAPQASGRKTPQLKELQAIRVALLGCIADVDSVPARRLSHKIMVAESVQELWLLRNDAYQLISQQTSQTEAAERINALMPTFQGWVEPRQLVRIK